VLVQRNHLKKLSKQDYNILKDLFIISADLYNEACIYSNKLFDQDKYSKKSVYDKLKKTSQYGSLLSENAQIILRQLDSNISTFLNYLTKGKKAGFPRPKQVRGSLTYLMSNKKTRGAMMVGNRIRLSLGRSMTRKIRKRYIYIRLPPNLIGRELRQIKLRPTYYGKYIEVIYTYKNNLHKLNLNKENYMGIDLGLNNFATCVTANGPPLIYEGKGLKSYNRWYNKGMAGVSSLYTHFKNEFGEVIRTGKKKQKLGIDRMNVVENFMNQLVADIIKWCLSNNIGRIVYGDGPFKVKRGIKSFKDPKLNQNFQYIPYTKFRDKLFSKCNIYGIDLIEVNEDMSTVICNKCGLKNSIDRLKKGYLHCRNCSTEIHADVNAAINIIRNVAPSFWSSGCMIQPRRIKVVSFV
jgi:IS605 OrfB family transposase